MKISLKDYVNYQTFNNQIIRNSERKGAKGIMRTKWLLLFYILIIY